MGRETLPCAEGLSDSLLDAHVEEQIVMGEHAYCPQHKLRYKWRPPVEGKWILITPKLKGSDAPTT